MRQHQIEAVNRLAQRERGLALQAAWNDQKVWLPLRVAIMALERSARNRLAQA